MKLVKSNQLSFAPASHEDQHNPQVWKKVLFKKEDLTNGRVQMVNWAKLLVGNTFRNHYHEDMEEIFIVLNGRAEIHVSGEKEELEKGDAVVIPRGQAHKMKNVCDEDVEYLVVGITLGKGGKTIMVKEKK